MTDDDTLETPDAEPDRLSSGLEFTLTVVLLLAFIGVMTGLALYV